jgi:hypothetical protein
LVVFADKELVRWDGYNRTHAEQELEYVGSDSAENGHSLQEFDPRFVHDIRPTAAADICYLHSSQIG